MEVNESFGDLGPGLHVLREAEPLKRAGSMAAHMRAELCATLPQADATLAARSTLPPIDVGTLTTLQVLARRVARAERIAERTRERAVAEVGQQLTAAGSGLAIHPTAVRDRAAAVEAARTELMEAERALADHVAEAAAADAAAVAEDDRIVEASQEVDHAVGSPTRRRARRAGPSPQVRRSRSLGVLVSSFGVVLLVLGLDLLPLWAALLFPLAASLWAMRYLRPRRHDDEADREEAASFLAEVAATTDELFGARRLSQELADRTAHLEVRRNRAEEEVRVAERAWHELAGPEADVADVEAVVKRFDPQHEDVHLVASETAGVRATEVVLHQFRQRWHAFWRELGLTAPDPAEGERAVDELAERVGRPIVLVGPAAIRGPELARVAPAAPVVVLEGAVEEDLEVS